MSGNRFACVCDAIARHRQIAHFFCAVVFFFFLRYNLMDRILCTRRSLSLSLPTLRLRVFFSELRNELGVELFQYNMY